MVCDNIALQFALLCCDSPRYTCSDSGDTLDNIGVYLSYRHTC